MLNEYLLKVLSIIQIKGLSLKSFFLLFKILITIGFLGTSHSVFAGLTASVTLQSGAPTDIKPGEITTLEITLSNNNAISPINNVAFSNSLPGILPNGLKVAGVASYTCFDPAGGGSTNPGAGTFTANLNTQALILANGVIPAQNSGTNGSCTLLIPVTAGTDVGAATNYTYTILNEAVTGNDGGAVANIGNVSQSINITGVAQPTINKTFSNSVAVLGGAIETLTIIVTNSETVPIPNFSITDTFPSAGGGGAIIQVVNPGNATSTCNLTGTPAGFSPALLAGDTSITVTGGTVAGQSGATNGTCTITVEIEARHTNSKFQTNVLANTINAVSDFTNDTGIQAQANATANISAQSPLQITKSFSPLTLADGQNGTLTIVLTNNGNANLTVQSFMDSPIDGTGNVNPAIGLKVNGSITVSCPGGSNGTFVATASNLGIIQTTNSTIAAGGACTITTPFIGQVTTANTPITYTNTIPEGAVNVGNPAIISQTRTATILVSDTLRILKSRNTNNPRPGNPVEFAVTVQNFSATDFSNVQILDVLGNGFTFLTGTINSIDYTPTLSGTAGCSGLTVSNVIGDTNANFVITTIPQRINISTPGACTITFYAMVDPNAANGSSTVNNIAAGAVCTNFANPPTICNGAGVSSTESVVDTNVLDIVKSFSPVGPLNEGTISRMTLALNNFSANPLTSLTISDTLPIAGSGGQIQIANPPNVATTCGGNVTVIAGGSSIALNGGTVPARANLGAGSAGSCNLQVDVVGPAGVYTNTATAAGTETYANGVTNTIAPVSDNANLTYNSILSASKSFNPASVASGGRSTVTVRLSNSGAVALANLTVTDPLPVGMVVASPGNVSTSCSGSTNITAVPGANSVTMTGATIAGTASCDLLFDVIATGTASWINTIPVGGIIATDTGVNNQSAVSGTLVFSSGSVLTIAKATNPSTIAFPGQPSRLTITINNGTQALTNLRLNDFFTIDGTSGAPSNGMTIAAVPSASTTCSGGLVTATALGNSVGLSGATLNANASCTFSVNVTSTIVGGLTNFIPIGAVNNNQGLSNAGQATTSLTTQGNLGISKQFIPNTLKPGVRGRLRLNFINPQQLAVSSLAVIDTLPAGVVVPSGSNPITTCTGATVSSPAANQVQVASGSLAAASNGVPATCFAEIDILAALQGDYTNTIPIGGLTGTTGSVIVTNSQPATDIVRVKTDLIIHKAFSSQTLDVGNPVGFNTGVDIKSPGQTSIMTIRLDNSNAQPLTQTAFTNALPSGLFLAPTPNASTTCVGGVVSVIPSGTSVRLSGATIPAGGFCTVTVSVLSNVPGTYTCSIAAGDVTTSEGVSNASPTSAQLVVTTLPSIRKQFSPAVIPPSGTATLSIFLENNNTAAITLTSILTDNLPTAPGAMTIAATPNVVKTCPGAVTANAGNNSLSYANGSQIPAGGCTINVDVTAAIAGTYNNTIPTGALQTNSGNNQQPANASLILSNLGYISGSVFMDNNVIPNGTFENGTDTVIAGTTIELHSGATCGGVLVSSTTTDSNGNYLFFDLVAGTYSVCELSQPAGTINGITTAGILVANNGSTGAVGTASNPTATSSEIVNIILNGDGAGSEVSGSPNNDFAEIATSSISGVVFLDDNNDGNLNGIDTGINAVTINLTGFSYGPDGIDNSGAGDDISVSLSTTTNSSGAYSFNNLAPGQYIVTEPTQPANTSNGITTPGVVPNGGTTGGATNPMTVPSIIGGGVNPIILPPNTQSTENNFAEISNIKSILGLVFLDNNNNGVVDGSDQGLGGQIINLTGTDTNGNSVVATTTTATDGTYSFTGLPPGTYIVTQPNQPASTNNGQTSCITPACVTTNTATTPSVISVIDLTGSTLVSAENNFAETPFTGGGGGSTSPNLAISKTHAPNTFIQASTTNLYTITPSNIGLADTAGTVTVVDTLPAGISATGTPTGIGWNCSVAGQVVTCTSNTVISANSSGNIISINVSVASGLTGQLLTNSAVISGGSEPPIFSGNNTATDIATVAAFDYGDAPDSANGTGLSNYMTTSSDNGASHLLGGTNAPYLGSCVDSDNGLLQNITANADDSTTSALTIGTCAAGDDEDGVVFLNPFMQNNFANFTITQSLGTNNCILNAWIDYNQNGNFNDVNEQIATDLIIGSGITGFIITNVPATAAAGQTYARFRCSSIAGLNSTGIASDGEVEDYQITIVPNLANSAVDYGDAPDVVAGQAQGDYSTIAANNGPSHVLVAATPYLGACVDSDNGTAQNTVADADDITAAGGLNVTVGVCATVNQDEDGVAFSGQLSSLTPGTVQITTGSASAAGSCILNGWIDFNQDGGFTGPGEQVILNQTQTAGSTSSYQFNVPVNAFPGVTYARFRCSSVGGLAPVGPAPDGEVEDYLVNIIGKANPIPTLSEWSLILLMFLLAWVAYPRLIKIKY